MSTNSISGIANFERPLLIENSLNFNPAINFDGTNDFLRTNENSWDANTVIMVFNPTANLGISGGIGDVELILVYDIPDNPTGDAGIGIGPLGSVGGFGGLGSSTFFNSTDSTAGAGGEYVGGSTPNTGLSGDPVLAVVRENLASTQSEHIVWGEDQDPLAIMNLSQYEAHQDRPFTIGQRHGGGLFYQGDVLEAISYSSRIGDADLARIQSYLSIKYGLTLDQSTAQDYVNSMGTTVYDSNGVLAAYDFNIAGIARDDDSGLNQKQSRSTTINSVQTSNAGIVTIGLGSIATTNVGNTNAFGADRSFLVWGNNATSTAISTSVVLSCGSLDRMQRTWAIQETGTVGDVEVSIPQSFFSSNTPTLIMSNDTTFTGDDTLVTLTDDGSGNYSAVVDFPLGDNFFTFGELDLHVTEFAGAGWTNGVPTASSLATISANYDTTVQGSGITACELTINSGVTLTITDENSVSVENDFVNNGDLVIENTGSLVQVQDTAVTINNGSISVAKMTPVIDDRNFVVMSSPVSAEARDRVYASARRVHGIIPSNFTPFDLSSFPEFSGAENFLDDDNDYLSPVTGSTALPDAGIGQLVFPQPMPGVGNGAYTLTYTQNASNPGTLNSGTINVPIHYNGPETINNFNLLGNPYASAIDVVDFINANDAVNEVYYWDHINMPSSSFPGPSNQNFNMNDISVRNVMMGVGAVNGGVAPGQFMASGQGFGIKADQAEMSAGTPVVFTNSLRVVGNNDGFRNNESATTIDKLWMNLTISTHEDAQSQVAIGFTEQATSAFDPGYDSKRLGTFLSLFTTLDTGEFLSIQGREPFNSDIEIPLGFSSVVEETATYTISIDRFEGVNIENTPIYIIDNVLNKVVNIKDEDYSFVSNNTIEDDRFTIVFQEKEVLGVEDSFSARDISLYPNPSNGQVTLSYTGDNRLNQLSVSNVSGKLIREIDLINFNQSTVINLDKLSKGVYFISVISDAGIVAEKLIIN